LWGDPTPLHLHTREEEAFMCCRADWLFGSTARST
jgi:hypothetical protein